MLGLFRMRRTGRLASDVKTSVAGAVVLLVCCVVIQLAVVYVVYCYVIGLLFLFACVCFLDLILVHIGILAHVSVYYTLGGRRVMCAPGGDSVVSDMYKSTLSFHKIFLSSNLKQCYLLV
jgi:hypothetical protein